MTARRNVLLSAAIVAGLGLAASHKKDEAPAADPKAVAAAQAVIASPAWLRQHLPAQTVAYLRIPSPWGMLGAVPAGRPLDAALSTKAHLDAIAKIRESIGKDKLLADLKIAPVANLLLGDLRSPIEGIIVDPLGIPSFTSRVVVTVVLDFPSVDAFNARLKSLGGETPLLKAPLDAQGNGQLASDGGALHYDVTTRRLWVTGHMKGLAAEQPGIDGTALTTLIADVDKATAATAPASLSALEPRIDTSGEGFFGWISMRGIGAVAAAQAGDSSLGRLPADFASKADAVAFGAGTVNGRGQLQLLVHAPQARLLQYLSPTSFAPTVKSVGAPHWAVTLNTPTAETWKAFEGNLNLDFGAEGAKAFHESVDRLSKRYHFDPERYTAWFGPETVVFADDAGLYYATRVRDWKGWHELIDQNKGNGWKTGTAKVDGAEVHWLSIPGQAATNLPPDSDPSMRAFMQMVDRFGGRTWWTEEGDWAVFAKVPQALSDRAAAGPDTSLDDWFKARSYPGQRTVAGFTATTHGAQRDAYYLYLSLLQFVAGATGSDADISTLPSAHTLGLPDRGVLGAALEADKDTLGFSLTYEHSPVELVGEGGGVTVIAGTAILAAIAVPQYQEYTLRSQVAGALSAADPVKTAVAEHRLTTGKFPASNKAAGLGDGESLGNDYVSSVEVGQGGEITVNLDGEAPHKADTKLDGGQLILLPRVEGGKVGWTCSGEGIDEKYLPASCQDALPGL
ncbi:MAG: pilin [Luteibacter sp.]|uniref:pilin n=1 Tax=Luteibacter sp. TaxID=1886636 RepID=UPI00280A2114|nr:pilin [Luteibacter sp.]MDQ7997889.1 pilin [Luteibacter sp.]MDQ8049550.1 pilin [Luteibacter sp.]